MKNRVFVKYGLITACLAILCILVMKISAMAKEQKAIEANRQSIPEFQFATYNGTSFTQQNLIADMPSVFVNFDPGCGFCDYQVKDMFLYESEWQNVNVVFISPADPFTVETYMEQFDLTCYPNVSLVFDKADDFKSSFGFSGTPITLVYNEKGQLVEHFKGETIASAIFKRLIIN